MSSRNPNNLLTIPFAQVHRMRRPQKILAALARTGRPTVDCSGRKITLSFIFATALLRPVNGTVDCRSTAIIIKQKIYTLKMCVFNRPDTGCRDAIHDASINLLKSQNGHP